jgi:hypothetical protein
MGFVWVNSVAVGSIITSATATEIETNTDWLKDNLACYANKVYDKTSIQSSNNNPYYVTNQASNLSGYYNGNDNADDGGYESYVCGTYQVAELNVNQSGYDATANAPENVSYYPSHYGSADTPVCSSYYTSDDATAYYNNFASAHCSVDYGTFDNGVCTSQNGSVYTSVNGYYAN